MVHAVERLSARVKELEQQAEGGVRGAGRRRPASSAPTTSTASRVLILAVEGMDANSLRDTSDTARQKLGDAVVVLGSATDGRVHLVANVAPSVVERGVSAADLVKAAAPIVGGGGGGRDTLAQAGGKDPEKLEEALAVARAEIEKALALMRVLALDHGSARCGAAISDPTGTLATPLDAVERPDTKRGLAAVARLVEEKGAERVVVGPSAHAERRGGRAGRARAHVCRAAGAESLGTGGASRRAPHDATRGANRGRARRRLACRRPPARELPCSRPGGHPRVSSGPPPVPGGRTPEEREAARREREARRSGQPVEVAPPAQSGGRSRPGLAGRSQDHSTRTSARRRAAAQEARARAASSRSGRSS